jgi:hypothetical protein
MSSDIAEDIVSNFNGSIVIVMKFSSATLQN